MRPNNVRRLLPCLGLLALSLLPSSLHAQRPATVPERTDFRRTSSTAEVRAFLDSLLLMGAPMAVTSLGTSAGGTDLPLVIVSAPRVTTAAEARATGRLVVYVQANIHGGEVEGKEAVQQLLRELAGPERALLEELVILVVPVYNADGNDALGPQERNRRSQNGPALIGLRPDAMNLDLNRDYLKAEAPETRAALTGIITAWDPALTLDLHTTNGTLHGYSLTYAPPLDPNGPAAPTEYVRDRMLPAVRATLAERHDIPVFDYGNVGEPDPAAWTTYSPLAWFGINYIGLRGRLAILSEAYSHDDFRSRVEATHAFVLEALRYAAGHADEIRGVIATADLTTAAEGARGPDLAIAWEPVSRGTESILLEVDGVIRPTPMRVLDRFRATETRSIPAGYFLPASETEVVALLRLHGITVERLLATVEDTVEAVRLDSLVWAPRPFQGHRLLTVRGATVREVSRLPAGTWFVPTGQPLGRLVFTLLEPEGVGLPQWNVFDRLLGAQFEGRPTARFPVLRAVRPPMVPRVVVP